jgi:hypothetical protein
MTNLFARLIPLNDLKKTIYRFPLSAACSFLLFTLLILSIHDIIDIDESGNLVARLMVLLACGFFWFVLARLIREGKNWRAASEYALGFGVATLLILAVFTQAHFSLVWLLTLMIPALWLGIAIGPYLDSPDNVSFWFYNRQVWQGVAIAILAGLLWGGGISAALASVDYLFAIDVEGELYADIWSFALIVFAPLYALSWIPEQYHYTEADCDAAPQLSFMLNWVLAPLTVVYMLILYAYFIKIALVQELPRGQLSYMVTAFGGLGVFTYLAGWPLRDTGGALLRLVHKLFFPLLVIPVAMQAVSIYLRINQYGVTEQRYVIALSVVWFGFLALGYSLKKPPLKIICGFLSVLLLAAAIGPFSAPKIAEQSQLNRLETLLVKNAILVNGEIIKTEQKVSIDDRLSISSILTFLQQRKRLDRLAHWMPSLEEGQSVPYPQELTKQMGFDYVHRYQLQRGKHSGFIMLTGKQQNYAIDVSGFDYLIPSQQVYCHKQPCEKGKGWQRQLPGEPAISIYYEGGQLNFIVAGYGEIELDVQAYARTEFIKDYRHDPRELTMEKTDGKLRVRLIFDYFNARHHDKNKGEKDYVLQNYSFRALISYRQPGLPDAD